MEKSDHKSSKGISPSTIAFNIFLGALVVVALYFIAKLTQRVIVNASTSDVYQGQYYTTGTLNVPSNSPVLPTSSTSTMKFVYFGTSSLYSTTSISNANDSVTTQTQLHFAPYYGSQATFVGFDSNSAYYNSTTQLIDATVIPIFIVQTGDYATGTQAAAAYHSVQTINHGHVDDSGVSTIYKLHAGQPYIVIYQENVPESIFSYVLSHEILETLVNPNVSEYVVAYDYDGNGLGMTFKEVCDPIEFGTRAQRSYTINSNPVSNFVLPSWFSSLLMYKTSAELANTPFDILNVLTKPFQIVPEPNSIPSALTLSTLTKNDEEENEKNIRKFLLQTRIQDMA